MSTMVVETRITHKYLMNKTKYEIADLLMLTLDTNEILVKRIQELENALRTLSDSGNYSAMCHADHNAEIRFTTKGAIGFWNAETTPEDYAKESLSD